MKRLLSRRKKIFGLLLAALAAGVALGLGGLAVLGLERGRPLALPVPAGEYSVGRRELDWTSAGRPDPWAGQPGASRELAVWIWYPAGDGPCQPAPYLPPAWRQARDREQGIGLLIERDFSRIQTHACAQAPLAGAPGAFPVLILEPGMGPAVPDYTVLAEELASRGYVVVGANPTGTANLVVFPDGRAATQVPQGALPDRAAPDEADRLGASILGVWTQDVIFVLDELEKANASPDGAFYRRLDLAHTGVFGHSFGGAAALAVCQQDRRCQAGANLDGVPFGNEASTPVPVPFLLMRAGDAGGCGPDCAAFRRIAGQARPGPVFHLAVQGAAHFDFSDLPRRWLPAVRPLFAAAGYTGSLGPDRGEAIAGAYLLAFFDRYLKGADTGLLNGPSPLYPEVRFY